VRALPNVTFAPPCDIVDLSTTPDAGRVTGVRVVDRGDVTRSRTVAALKAIGGDLMSPGRRSTHRHERSTI
jgi:hypothetical protein